ncbi:MAG: hypothetical protein HY508_07315 [Acidobacteria bacterium]|nr:hypothetical protein [Acidobacteriota bacterium]
MGRTILITLIAVLSAQGRTSAQNFAGQYTFQDTQGTTSMSVQQDDSGRISGSVTMDDGSVVNLQGEIKGTEAIGIATIGEKNTLFKLHFQGEQLIYTMIAVTADNKPDLANAQQFPFSRTGGGKGGTGPAASGGANPLAGGGGGGSTDPLARTFTDGKMTLQLQGRGGRYQGQIQFQGQTFPATAQSPDGRSLTGKFTSGSDSFDFTGKLQGSTLSFTTGGTSYQLRGEGGTPTAAANPLSGDSGSSATPARGGQRPQPIAGGNVVNDPSMGVRFSVPPGWKHQKQQTIYMMGHDTIPGMILIMPHTSNSIQELAAAANEPLYQAQDGQLMVTSAPVTLTNNMLAADYGGNIQGKEAKGRIVGVVSPHGGGFLIMAGADTAGYSPQHAQLAEGIARSMNFTKPQLPPEAAMWKQKLTGMRVKSFKHGGSSDAGGAYSWSDERDIDLCSDGAFQSTGGFQGSLGTAGGSAIMNPGNRTRTGQWTIIGQAGQPALQLRHSTGNVETFVLSANGSQTLLDGVRWYVIENPTCR